MATSAPQPTTLFNRDFFLLWTLEVTGSATAMGLMLTANRIATIVLGPFAGAFVDSHPRLRTIVACDFGRGALTCALAASFFYCRRSPW
jgi:MFS family permease